MDNNELVHWGIKGMRWGVRRYQNKDGSLTEAGRKRVAKLDAERNLITGGNKTASSSINKKISDMSNEELRTRIERTRLESDYIDAKRRLSSLTPQETKKGNGFVKKAWNNALEPALINSGKKVAEEWLTKKGQDWLGLSKKDTKDGLDALKKEAQELNLKKQINENKKYFENEKKSKNMSDSESSKKDEEASSKEGKKKYYTGTILNDEPKHNASSGRKYARDNSIFDDEWEDVTDRYSGSGRSVYNSLESTGYLSLPAPKKR